jgi:CrcB protein
VSVGTWVAFLAAAAIGAPVRYLVDGLIQDLSGGEHPWGTSLVNITGSLLLGLITGFGLYHALASDLRFIAGTGFCGAYTTFSTFSFETIRLAEAGAFPAAVRNVAVNLCGGMAAAALGLFLAAR